MAADPETVGASAEASGEASVRGGEGLGRLRQAQSERGSVRRACVWACALLPALGGCAGVQSTLDPAGAEAARVASWWWWMFVLAMLVFVLVLGLLVATFFRSRRTFTEPAAVRGRRGWLIFVLTAGAVLPSVVLSALMGGNVWQEAVLARSAPEAELTIEVTGHRWWWEIRYPEHGVVTANELHVPAGVPVRLELTSADVIHSLWVPSLAGKRDLVPGQTNVLRIEATEPGIYRGQCAEFCGVQHARMGIVVMADRPDTFADWLSRQREAAAEPTRPDVAEGRRVFLSSPCVGCHTIRGTAASGEIGPDLTHVASRSTLAAATLTNGRGNLAGWIVDSQEIKPGNAMPPMPVAPQDLGPLLDYLQSLR